MIGKDAAGSTLFGFSSVRVDVYSETARSQLEQALVGWNDVDVIERQQRAVFERELALNEERQGDRAERELLAKQHGVDFYIFGQIVSIEDEVLNYEGYGVPRKIERTTATIFVRVVQMAPERVVFSTETIGKSERITTPFRSSSGGNAAGTAVRRAILNMVESVEFRRSLVERVNEAAVGLPGTKLDELAVSFDATPSDAMVELDGFHIGSTPISRSLAPKSEHVVRISKPGFLPWEGRIKVDSALVVKVELEVKK